MKYVAIVKSRTHFFNYGDDYDVILDSISDWSEVTDEDYEILQSAVNFQSGLVLLERVDRDPKVIPNLISDYIKEEKKRQEKAKEEKKKREAAATQRALKKKAKTEAEEKKLLGVLLQKHGGQINVQ